MMQPSRFSFVDEGEALRRLNVDRDMLLQLVRERRLRAYPGVGKGNFYRMRDLEALYEELYAETSVTGKQAEEESTEGDKGARGKPFDPAYKVHVRLQADLKWYDLSDEELQAWVREMHADGYARQRANITMVTDKLKRLISLMDEAAAGWQVLKSPIAPVSQPGPPIEQVSADPASARRGKPLPMLGGSSSPAAVDAPVAPPSPSPTRRGKPLPLAGGATPTEAADAPGTSARNPAESTPHTER